MFDEYILTQAQERPDAPAMITPFGTWSFRELDAAVNRAAFELRDVVPSGQEPVRVDVSDGALQWMISLALARRGIASSPANDVACSVTVSNTKERGATYVLDFAALERMAQGGWCDPPAKIAVPQDLGRVITTSGTTGEVKRIGLSWSLIDARVRHAQADYARFDGPCLVDATIDTALGLVVTLGCWASGNAVIWNCPLENGSEVARLRPRIIAAVPYRLQQLLDALPEGCPKWPLNIISGGGPITRALNDSIRRRLTDEVANVYGSSEAGAVAIADLATMARVERTGGYILRPGEVEIVAPDGTPVAPGELGEIRVRGETVADGYLPPDESSAFRDGWYYTSDLGRLEPDGLLTIEGRIDDVMNLGGIKVLPSWIEEAARTCPGVEDVAAFALTDTSSVNSCYLALVTSADFRQDLLEQRLAEKHRYVAEIRLMPVPSIPRNVMGKVERVKLRDLAQASQNPTPEPTRAT